MSQAKSALIIANYRYESPDLRQLLAPAQDAESLARVLGDPMIGGFQVQTLINEPSYKLSLEIESFCDNRKRDDLLLLYFSGHGIKDAVGQLYFATVDTQLVQHNVRRATAVAAHFINEVMSRSRSRRQILLLDCCYSGAFKEGMLAKGDKRVGAGEQFEGQGRVVLTASDALQYSFEGGQVQGEGVRSVFTHMLVRGLETGEADLDRDGFFSLDEVYDYVYARVSDEQPEQKPTKMGYVEGKIFIGNNPRPLAAQLPSELRESLEDPRPWVRLGAVQQLEKLLAANSKGLMLAAHAALARFANEDDSQQVRTAAAKCLAERGDLPNSQASAEAKQQQLARDKAEKSEAAAQAEETRKALAERERQERERIKQENLARQRAEYERQVIERAEAERRKRAEREHAAREEAEALPKAEQEPGASNVLTHTSVFLALLVLAVLNQVLLSGVSFAAPTMIWELQISYVGMGYAYSALAFAYAVCAPFAGMAVSRFGTRRVVSLGLILSAVATALAAVAANLTAMLAALALQGCGLSTVVPAFCAIFARYDGRRRPLANALFEFVSHMAKLALPMLSFSVLTAIGWRSYIGAGAGAAAVFAAAWMLADRSIVHGSPIGPSGRTLRTGTALGCFAAYFGYSYCLQSIFTLFHGAGAPINSLAGMHSALPLALGASAMLSGVLSARLIASNQAAALNICKRFVIGGLLLAALNSGLAFLGRSNMHTMYIFTIGSCVGLGTVGPSLWTLVQSAAPTGTAARWGGFQALFGTLGGTLASFLVNPFRVTLGILSVVGVVLAATLAAALLIATKKLILEDSGGSGGLSN